MGLLPPTARPTNAVESRTVPAWALSLVVHGTLLGVLAMLLHSSPRGAANEPVRQAGIVLKRTSESGDELYAGEEDAAEAIQPAKVHFDALLNALPSPATAPAASDALPAIEAVGPSAAGGGLPHVGELIRGGGGRPQLAGGEARVRVFGVEGTGNRFVYAFDRSVSMAGAPLTAAKVQLVASLDSLDSVHQFQIIFFNHRLQIPDLSDGQQRIAFATEANKLLANRFVDGITADGGTDRLAALTHAVRLRPDVIFFLTDADDPMPASELAEVAATNRRVGASINTIEFGRGLAHRKQNFVVRLAEQSGGQYVYVDTLRLRTAE